MRARHSRYTPSRCRVAAGSAPALYTRDVERDLAEGARAYWVTRDHRVHEQDDHRNETPITTHRIFATIMGTDSKLPEYLHDHADVFLK